MEAGGRDRRGGGEKDERITTIVANDSSSKNIQLL